MSETRRCEMELEELKSQWAALDRKLETRIQLHDRVLRIAMAERARAATARVSWWTIPTLLVNVLAVVWLGSFIADHTQTLRFVFPAAALVLVAAFLTGMSIRALAALGRLDFDGPVVPIQVALERLRVQRSRTTKLVFLLSPLLWTPILVVFLKGFLGIDAYAALPARWLLANVLFGVAMIPLLLWTAKRFGERFRDRPQLAWLMDDLAGRSLTAARTRLDALARLERGAE